MGRISTGLGTSWESALTLGFFVLVCLLFFVFFWGVRRSVSLGACFRRRPLGTSALGLREVLFGLKQAPGRLQRGDARRRRSRARAGESAPTRGIFFVCVFRASRRLFVESRARSCRFFPLCAFSRTHARRGMNGRVIHRSTTVGVARRRRSVE